MEASMPAPAAYVRQVALPARLLPAVQIVVGLAILAVLSVPLLRAEPGPLTSDESLYVAEGLNLAQGQGYTYPTGEPVNHRGPLFPGLLAADFSVSGVSLDHALWVTRLFALGNALLLFALCWRLFGREAGWLAAAVGLASALLTLMGTSLFLDGVETFFLLLTLLLLHPALLEGKARWAALAGASLGLAMLTKESALLWLPLPFVAVLLLGPAVSRPRALLIAYSAGCLAVAGWWWPYVYVVTGQVYLLGEPSQALVWLGAGALCLALAALAASAVGRRGVRRALSVRVRWLGAGLLLALWGGFFLFGLEAHSTWGFPRDYLRNVPEYAGSVLAAWLRPLPLIGLAWAYVAYRAVRGSLGDRLLLLGLLLFLPFVLFVANRDLHIRDILPVVYLSYAALARSAIDFARWLADVIAENFTPAAGSALAALVVLGAFGWYAIEETQRFDEARAGFDPAAVRQDDWDNPLARRTAKWMSENVPPGTPIMSARLYSSHLYTLTDGRYPVWQLPTVRVDFEGSPPSRLTRATTLFRWEDHQIPAGPAEPWLYLRRYPYKHYYIALSEQDLLADLKAHDIGYLILTGDDAGFSSLSLLPYFEEHPAFQNVASFIEDESNQVHIFRVRPSPLTPIAAPAAVSRTTAAALEEELGVRPARALLEGLSPAGYLLTGTHGSAALPADEP